MNSPLSFNTTPLLRGVVYAFGFVLLWSLLAVFVRRYDGQLPLAIPTSLRPLGFMIATLGGVLAVWSGFTFVTLGRGTQASFDPPRELVAEGPYRYLRNPMYLGDFAVFIGAGLAFGSFSILGLGVLFLLIAHAFVCLYEEPALARRFPAYRNYRATVPRWAPRIHPPSDVRDVD